MTISDEVVEAALKAFNLKWDELHNHLGGWALGGSSEATQSMRAAIEAAVEAERERIAAIFEHLKYDNLSAVDIAFIVRNCFKVEDATAIRNRKSGVREGEKG